MSSNSSASVAISDLTFLGQNMYPALRMQRDAYITDSIFSTYGVLVDHIPILMDVTNTQGSFWRFNDTTFGVNVIRMNMNSWPAQRICHEVGHEVAYEIQGTTNPTTPFADQPHDFWSVSDTIFAFDEGFAEFVNAISTIADLVGTGSGTLHPEQSFENNTWWQGPNPQTSPNNDGSIVEGSVASVLLDLYDDDNNPRSRTLDDAGDNVRNSALMMPIILGCLSNWTDTVRTWSLNTLAHRMVRETNLGRAPWVNDPDFKALRPDICDIFSMHRYIVPQDFCKTSAFTDDDADEDSGSLPISLALQQNYPNPFNGGTTVSFSVAIEGDYKIELYNVLGKRVFTDELRSLDVGIHNYEFSEQMFGDLASGIYLYALTGRDVNLVKKMVYLK